MCAILNCCILQFKIAHFFLFLKNAVKMGALKKFNSFKNSKIEGLEDCN